jgi:Ca2+-binding EF-hand superfamily protein
MLQEGDVSKQEVRKKLREVRKSWKSKLQDGREDLNSVFKRLASLPETPTAETPTDESPDGPVLEDVCDMVNSIDGNRSGNVNYTLLVAALLPEHVYCDDLRIVETFNIFDVRGHGKISPRDLRVALQCPKGYKGRFSRMIEHYDRDGDGAIDLPEFRAMVRGETAMQQHVSGKRTSAFGIKLKTAR